jgi:eukaryotic-like serine/threonine-protein kinase
MNERDIFLSALEIVDPAKRAEWLEAQCGNNAELRKRVDELIQGHNAAGAFLDQPAAPEMTGAYNPSPKRAELAAGDIFAGRYKIRERLGEGGMGVVYVAEQTQPVQRRVALKVIKADMSSDRLLVRFEAERQALALMDHPNIAKVFDAGVDAPQAQGRTSLGFAPSLGVPYFVMELIKGVPITKYSDDAKLTPKQRLELFIPVCQAVQHAHQKGIIHRDLKPSNVIVGLYDGRPVPKVIDFGVAKATGTKLTDKSVYTEVGSIVGTLEYMSPEQAEFNNLDIDTRSDIYALGVLLYELLTGTVPFSRKELQSHGFAEMLRIIKEVEPQKPSTRLSGSGSLPSLAACRHTEPKKLSRLFRGELDWMVMKALEKDRSRRYETANGFAMDIQRYLADEPVLAGPPSATYRMKKFVKRNKAQVVAAGLVLLTLLGGIGGTTIGLIEAKRQERIAFDLFIAKEIARQTEAEQRQIAEANEAKAIAAAVAERQAKVRETEQRAKAEKARDRTRDVLDAMTSSATGDSLSTQKEISKDQKKFLTEVLTYYWEFAGEKADDEQSRARTANAAYRVGGIEYRLGRTEQGIAALKMARDGYRTLAADFPAVPAYRSELARSHNNLGVLLYALGKRAEAEEQYRQALAVFEKLAADFPTVPAYRRDLAGSHNNLGALLADLRKRAEAEEQYRQALAVFEKLAADFPTVPEYRQDLAMSHNNLGILVYGLGKRAEAEAQFREALAIREKLAADFPTVPDYRQGLATSHNNLGPLLYELGKRTEAEEQFRKALAIQEKLAADFPTVPAYQIDLGRSYGNYGLLVRDGGRAGESLGWYEKAIATLAPIHRAEPRDGTAKQSLRASYAGRAAAYDALTKPAEAIKDWDRAIELSPPTEQLGFRASRATSRLQAGLVAEAVAEVAELTKSSNWNANQWYDFACIYAVASGKIADEKQEYADRAMELLRKAVKAGYKDAAHMAKDTDLDSLRGREDFKKLMAELGAAKKP